MPAPSPLAIATSAVVRLQKEAALYRKEAADQEREIGILEEKLKNGTIDDDGNDTYMLKQQRLALVQTNAVFEPLKKRTDDALSRLEEQIAMSKENTSGGASETELETAEDVLRQAQQQAETATV